MPNVFGYLKTVKDEKTTQRQIDRLKVSGVANIYQESPSRKKVNTTQLDKLLAKVQKGDTLIVTSLSSIAHSNKHLLETMRSLKSSGGFLKVLDSGIDTSTLQGEAMDLLLGSIVDFEQQVARERQSAGIARAKKEGRYKGRKPTARAKADEVMALNKKGLTRQKIAEELGIGVASVYRILKANIEPKKSRNKITKQTVKSATTKQKKIVPKPAPETVGDQLSFF